MSIETNIKARQAAEEAVEICNGIVAYYVGDPEFGLRFWEELDHRIGTRAGRLAREKAEADSSTMTDAEARLFGQSIVPWGAHKGATVDSVDLDYWFWMTEESGGFIRELRRYLKSDRIQQEAERFHGRSVDA